MDDAKRKVKYYKVCEKDDGFMYILESGNGGISVYGSPVFLRKEDGWAWLEKNYPNKLAYIPLINNS